MLLFVLLVAFDLLFTAVQCYLSVAIVVVLLITFACFVLFVCGFAPRLRSLELTLKVRTWTVEIPGGSGGQAP